MNIVVPLTGDERTVLLRMAEDDYRGAKDEVRWLIVQEARQRGLLPEPSAALVVDDTPDTGGGAL